MEVRVGVGVRVRVRVRVRVGLRSLDITPTAEEAGRDGGREEAGRGCDGCEPG